MKVGTDAVLLGAWADVSETKNILDIGSGTGVISLMMAQRSRAAVTAIEIETNAFEESCLNFIHSPWNKRITPCLGSFQNFYAKTREKFDLIITNPPFFENVSKASGQNRSNARHNDLLPFHELIGGSSGLMTETGKLALIIPVLHAENIIAMAAEKSLFIHRMCKVKPKPDKPVHRLLLEFSRKDKTPLITELTIETKAYQIYTAEYINLTREFYWSF